jgi:hypothetical protein
MAVKDRYPDALIQFEDFQTDMVGRMSAPCYYSHVALCMVVGLPYKAGTLAGPPLADVSVVVSHCRPLRSWSACGKGCCASTTTSRAPAPS